MNQPREMKFSLRSSKVIATFTILYFLIAAVEIIGEYYKARDLVYATKPFIILILIFLYWNTSNKLSFAYITALIFSWIANIFFISNIYESIFIGAILFFFYRVLTIYIVLKQIKLPSVFPTVVGCVPFLFIYMYFVNLTYVTIGEGLVVFVIQCILISFLGGLSVGNYILSAGRANALLLLSTLFFAVTQFIFVIRLYYTDSNIFQPLAMALFAIAQYLFYKFLLLAEEKKAGYKITADSNP
ncbi:MAG TPA: lysoplasmalogenase family protein [Flavobacterium sp.]|nr:lysoplasmalogenase family protein [Flavobacterium sp.]